MTIKNIQTNISAEPEDIVTNIQQNSLNKQNNLYQNDFILTITNKNLLNEQSHATSVQLPLSELITSDYLTEEYYDKNDIDTLKELYYTIQQIQQLYYTKTEVDSKIKVHFDVRNALPNAEDALTNYVYLIPYEENDEGYGDNLYKEYIYMETEDRFEMIGSTRIDLSPYLEIEDLNDYLIVTDGYTNLKNIVDSNTLNLTTLNSNVSTFFNKVGYSQEEIESFNIAVRDITDNNNQLREYWFLGNAYYDYDHNKFFQQDDSDVIAIKVAQDENQKYHFFVLHSNEVEEDEIISWTTILDISDSELNISDATVKIDDNRVLTEDDYDHLYELTSDMIPLIDSSIENSDHLVYNYAVYVFKESVYDQLNDIKSLAQNQFRENLWNFMWGDGSILTDESVQRGSTNLGQYLYDFFMNLINNTTITIYNRITSSIKSHNNNSAAHSDIRDALDGKASTSSVESLTQALSSKANSNHTHYGTDLKISNGSSTSIKDAIDGKADSSHTHGNISNDGKIGSSANLPIITTTSGKLTTGSFGNSANTFCQGNDSRLSDARTPTSHTHGDVSNDGKIGSTANKPVITGSGGKLITGSFGTTANTFCQGNDSRLSDARTPTAHTHNDISDKVSLSLVSTAFEADSITCVKKNGWAMINIVHARSKNTTGDGYYDIALLPYNNQYQGYIYGASEFTANTKVLVRINGQKLQIRQADTSAYFFGSILYPTDD